MTTSHNRSPGLFRVFAQLGSSLSQLMGGLLVVLLLAGCAQTQKIRSSEPQQPITVDGLAADWEGALRPVDGAPLAIGVQHDGTSLYVAVLANRLQAVQQVMGRGLTVWFDPEGGKKQVIGIRFPMGMRGGASEELRPGREDPALEALLRERFRESMTTFEVLREGASEGTRYPVGSLPNVDLAADLEAGTLFYELRLPLNGDPATDVALGVEPGQAIGINVATPETERRGFSGQNQRGGGFGDITSNDVGGTRSPQRPSDFQLPDRINTWLAVTLHNENGTR